MKFPLGQVVATMGIVDLLAENDLGDKELLELLNRHVSGDWGNLDEEDKKSNDEALVLGNRILSAYELAENRVWVITEWDRSVTTVLLPEEY